MDEVELENTYHYVINLLNEFENKLYACIKGNDLIIADIINKLRNIAMTSFGTAYNLLLNFKKTNNEKLKIMIYGHKNILGTVIKILNNYICLVTDELDINNYQNVYDNIIKNIENLHI